MAFLIAESILYAQDDEALLAEKLKNNINLGLAGNASLISVNYERLFFIKPIFYISGQLGIGYNMTATVDPFQGWIDDYISFITVPHHITVNLGKGKHFFEFGLGGAVINIGIQTYLLYPIAGYRIQDLGSGKYKIRIFVNYPVMYGKGAINELDYYLFSPVGVSVGYCF